MPTSTRTFDLSTIERFRKGLHANYGMYNDPTYLGFVLLFNDYDVEKSPLLVRDANQVGSALNYLKAIDDGPRFEYLKLFQDLLFDTNYWMPWYWQGIEGLDKVWDYKKLADPYKGGTDSVIEITTLESIDLRITALMDLYRRACFDYEFRREIVPSNLRKFQVTIFIQEVRNIQVDLDAIDGALNTINNISRTINPMSNPLTLPGNMETPQQKEGRATARIANEFGANMMFTLKYCEFDSDKSSGNWGSLNMAGGEPATQQISFTYDSIDESYLNPTIQNLPQGFNAAGMNYSFLDKLPDPITGSGKSFLQKISDLKDDPDGRRAVMNSAANNAGAALQQAALNQVDTLVAQGVNAIEGRLNRLLLGNVYGFSPSDFLSDPAGATINALQNGVVNALSPKHDNTPSALGNAYNR
jgi:hypothetical protein